MLPSELVLPNDKHWSARTVHRRLVNMGYKSYKANENHYENRLNALRIVVIRQTLDFCLYNIF